jgi:hypothetical protein
MQSRFHANLLDILKTCMSELLLLIVLQLLLVFTTNAALLVSL